MPTKIILAIIVVLIILIVALGAILIVLKKSNAQSAGSVGSAGNADNAGNAGSANAGNVDNSGNVNAGNSGGAAGSVGGGMPPPASAGVPSYSYIGCYKDTNTRDMKTSFPGSFSVQACYEKAKSIGAKMFGVQYFNRANNSGNCFAGDAYGSYGPASNCFTDNEGHDVGGSWSNAVYKIN